MTGKPHCLLEPLQPLSAREKIVLTRIVRVWMEFLSMLLKNCIVRRFIFAKINFPKMCSRKMEKAASPRVASTVFIGRKIEG